MRGSRRPVAGANRAHAIAVACLIIPAVILAMRLWGNEYLGRADLVGHLRFALSAKREIAAGQWPLAFLNDAEVGFQPFFLYYSLLPFFLAGATQIVLGVSPYDAVLLVAAACFVVSGLGFALVSRYLGMGVIPATIGACAYAFS